MDSFKELRFTGGTDDFRIIREDNKYYIDKSNFINDVLKDYWDVILITRPRRFGKSTNLSMLYHFFSNAEDSKELFKDLKIFSNYEIMQECNRYPVIFITLKNTKTNTWKETFYKIKSIILNEYSKHSYLLNSDVLNDNDKIFFKSIINKTANKGDYEDSLLKLTEYLYRYHKVKPIVLIDEYDAPIESGYINGYYDKIISFTRNLFGAVLKGNTSLYKAVLTGIIRVSQHSIFSELNNIKVYSIFNKKYNKYFGFTEEEVQKIAKDSNALDKLGEIKEWYDGYNFGDLEIYNPWSVINYFSEICTPKPYWVNTSSNDIIKGLLKRVQIEDKERLKSLLEGKTIVSKVEENTTFKSIPLDSNVSLKLSTLYSFLLFTGYLKSEGIVEKNFYKLKIPNLELKEIFETEVFENVGINYFDESSSFFFKALINKNPAEVQNILNKKILPNTSFYDSRENFYHGLVFGLIIQSQNKYIIIDSNMESGNGRYDIAIESKLDNRVYILELKFLSDGDITQLDKLSEEALEQINEKKYEMKFNQRGYKDITKYGIAFTKKQSIVKMK